MVESHFIRREEAEAAKALAILPGRAD